MIYLYYILFMILFIIKNYRDCGKEIFHNIFGRIWE